MNREFKFRVWHNFEKCWEEQFFNKKESIDFCFRLPKDISEKRYARKEDNTPFPYATLSHILSSPDIYTIQQFTGLKDKNGKEIYEGDIVNLFNSNKILIFDNAQIHFYKGMFKIAELNTPLSWDGSNGFIEVIGNIFENPELLT